MQSENGPPPSADATTWLTLADKANISTRTSESGREMRFEGPGKVNPCGHAVALVAEGSAMALPGGGNAPGAEQWVAAPCAVVRWSAGITKISVAKDECILQVSTGNAMLWVPPSARLDEPDAGPLLDAGLVDGWRRVIAKRTFRIRGGPTAEAAIAACESAAEATRKAASAVADAAMSDLGSHTVADMRSRENARAACALAEARAAGNAEQEQRIAKVKKDVLGSE
jgi:hypothetical protein